MTGRPTPYALVFGPLDDTLGDIDAAAAHAGLDLRSRREFGLVPEVQRLLADLQPPDAAEQGSEEYLVLLHTAFRFRRAGCPVRVVTRTQLEPDLGGPPPTTLPVVPATACYLQLPPNWFWGQRDTGQPHEPLDGMFVVEAPHSDEVTVVAVLGLRAEREGFTQIVVRGRSRDFAAAHALARQPPFAPTMEGGAHAGFRSVATAAELMALAHLALCSVAK